MKKLEHPTTQEIAQMEYSNDSLGYIYVYIFEICFSFFFLGPPMWGPKNTENGEKFWKKKEKTDMKKWQHPTSQEIAQIEYLIDSLGYIYVYIFDLSFQFFLLSPLMSEKGWKWRLFVQNTSC